MIPLPGIRSVIAARRAHQGQMAVAAGDAYFFHRQLDAAPKMPLVLGLFRAAPIWIAPCGSKNQARLRTLKATHGDAVTIFQQPRSRRLRALPVRLTAFIAFFEAKWAPVRVKKTRQTKENQRLARDCAGTGGAGAGSGLLGWRRCVGLHGAARCRERGLRLRISRGSAPAPSADQPGCRSASR